MSTLKFGSKQGLPLIDEKRIRLIESLNEVGKSDMVVELIEMFLTNGSEKARCIQKSMHEKRWKDAEREFHILKSTSGALGALQLEALCEQIEEFLDHDQFSEASAAAGDLGDLFTSTVLSLRQILAYRQTIKKVG